MKNYKIENTHFFNEILDEIRTRGYFHCSNPELAKQLYEELKPEYPQLYLWNDGSFDRINVINSIKQIESLIDKKEEYLNKIKEIDFILNWFKESL